MSAPTNSFSNGRMLFAWGLAFLLAMAGSSCKKEKSCQSCVDEKVFPRAVAGPDKTIDLPVDSVWLDGTGSRDPDGSISAYRWREISGPVPSTIDSPSVAATSVRSLLVGLYQFELTVTDNESLSSRDTVRVTVNAASVESDSFLVYVAGNEHSAPKYWKNGQGVELKLSILTIGHASDIAVDDKDVYVAGWEGDVAYIGENRAKYWKNGQEIFLSGATISRATAIAVSGTDVYVAGWESQGGETVAMLWKNGVAVRLTDGTADAHATGIAVEGGNVYVSGYDGGMAKCWRNGKVVGPAETGNVSSAWGIMVVGADVYLTGRKDFNAAYWKNDQAFTLSTWESNGKSIFVSGQDVYVAGIESVWDHTVARYWKNGQETILSGALENMIASDIYVEGNDVYVTGFDYKTSYRGGYWKNGQFVQLGSPGKTQTSSILIKRR